MAIHPNWDLDQYILNYSGHGQIHRLKFIALKSQPLQVDALRHAARLIKETTLNVPLYQETVEQLRLVDTSLPESVHDQTWIDNAARTTKSTTEKLEAELKNYKNNLIKESIRVEHSCTGC
jgi:COP9 signalosome complex subunit 1